MKAQDPVHIHLSISKWSEKYHTRGSQLIVTLCLHSVRHHTELLLKPAVELQHDWEELLDIFPGIKREELSALVASTVSHRSPRGVIYLNWIAVSCTPSAL